MNSFSINRLALLMQKNIYENSKNFLKGISILFGVFTVIIIFSMPSNFEALSYIPIYYQVGFAIIGIVVSGMAFSNLRSKEKTMSYLSIPASTFEKMLSELLISTIVFYVVYILLFYAFNFVMFLFGQVVDVPVDFINIFEEETLEKYWDLIIFQSIMFAGAATFMKRPLLSTGFSIFLAGIAILLYVVIFGSVLKATGLPSGITMSEYGVHLNNQQNNLNELFLYSSFIVTTAKNLFYYATVPVFWTIAYLKLKEKEV